MSRQEFPLSTRVGEPNRFKTGHSGSLLQLVGDGQILFGPLGRRDEGVQGNSHLLISLGFRMQQRFLPYSHQAAFLAFASEGRTLSRSPVAPRIAARLRNCGLPPLDKVR